MGSASNRGGSRGLIRLGYDRDQRGSENTLRILDLPFKPVDK